MRRRLLAAAAAIATAVPAAADPEATLRSRWHGAWLVLGTEVYSTCDESYTNNEISGPLVAARQGLRFAPGELARVHKVNLRRRGVDLLVNLAEARLVSWDDGPFELFAERWCKVELQWKLPRGRVRDRDVRRVEQQMLAHLERYATAEEARASEAWNRRRVEPFPPDYERTLAEYQAWKAAVLNAEIDERIEESLERALRIATRVETGDGPWAEGFVEGLEEASDRDPGSCERLLADDRPYVGRGHADADEAWEEGYEEGLRLGYYLARVQGLRRCRVAAR